MKVSVIIPVFNEEKVIYECLESLNQQLLNDFEIIVVDDGSTDKTNETVNSFKVKFLQQKHQGPAQARNLGSKEAKGDILVFVDSDMTFDSNFLIKLVEPIKINQTNGTFSKEEYVKNWQNKWAKCWNINDNLPAKRRLPQNYPDTQKVFRAILKSEFDSVGGFSKGGYTDDYTLSQKLGYEALNAPGAIFYHKNPDSLAEIFNQAKWIGKRDYKFGYFGYLVALMRSSLVLSIIIGLYKSTVNMNINFLLFKIVYDLGIFIGILEMITINKTAK